MHDARWIAAIAPLALGGGASGAFAQNEPSAHDEASDDADEWSIELTPYLWIPAMNGDVAVRGNDASIDIGVDDTLDLLFDDFNAAFVMHLEAHHEELALFGDAMYISLEDENAIRPATLGAEMETASSNSERAIESWTCRSETARECVSSSSRSSACGSGR